MTTFVFDFDGIIADTWSFNERGPISKTFQFGAGHALKKLVSDGNKVWFLTSAKVDHVGISRQYLERFGLDGHLIPCQADKKLAWLMTLDLSDVIYVSDDLSDVDTFRVVRAFGGLAICPNDTFTQLIDEATYSLPRQGMIHRILNSVEPPNQEAYHIVETLCSPSIRDVIVHQAYSMRSYETGLYDMASDGNLAFTLGLIHKVARTWSAKKFYITMPPVNQVWNFGIVKSWVKDLGLWDNVEFIEHKGYGRNIAESRETFYASSPPSDLGNVIVTFFPGCQYDTNTPYILVANAFPTEVENVVREYVESSKRALATYVFNSRQVKSLPRATLLDGIVSERFVMKTYEWSKQFVFKGVAEQLDEIGRGMTTFFPWRLTDPDYKFESYIKSLPDGSCLLLCDPNHTAMKFDLSRFEVTFLSDLVNDTFVKPFIYHLANTPIHIPYTMDLKHTAHQLPVEISFIRGLNWAPIEQRGEITRLMTS